MNKAELVSAVAAAAKVSKAQAKTVVEATLNAIKGALKKGEKVQLVGFGSFLVRQQKERVVRNPKTGEKIKVPARKVVRFKPSSELRPGK